MRKKWSMCICLLFTACMLLSAGCGTNTTADDQGTDLLVYYVKGHDYYGEALGAFIYSHSKYDITLQAFESDEDMCNQLATEIAAGQGPDVVLLSSESDFDIYKAVKSGNVADLSSYFENDEEFAVENYYESVLNAGIISGGQYLVPFTFGMESLLVNRTKLEDAGINIDNVADFDGAVSLVEAACEAADNETIGISIYNGEKFFTDNDVRYLIVSGVSLVDADGKVSEVIDQSQRAIDFLALSDEEYKNKREVFAQLSDISSCLAMSVCYNFTYTPSLAEYYTANNAAGDAYVSMPWKNINGQPQPVVCDYGFVNKNSKSKKAAYELLRYLMDYSEIPTGAVCPLSVNRSDVEKQLARMQQQEPTLANGTVLSKLSEESYVEIVETLDNMVTAIVYNTGYYDIASDQMAAYFSTGDKDGTLEDLKSELTRYLRE